MGTAPQTGDIKPVDLFWSGGWDSTYQLLKLLLLYKIPVRPFYLIDVGRRSLAVELRTMSRIRQELNRLHPQTRGMMLPTQYMVVPDIPPDEEITAAYHTIRSREHIGSQYEWLPRFCKHAGVEGIDLCIHVDDHTLTLLRPLITGAPFDRRPVNRLAQSGVPEEVRALFKYFAFPIHDLSKLAMDSESRANDWSSLMDMTWFCHMPRRGDVPCGECTPCRYVIMEGLAWRVPGASRRRAAIRRRLGIIEAEAFCRRLKRGYAKVRRHLRGEVRGA